MAADAIVSRRNNRLQTYDARCLVSYAQESDYVALYDAVIALFKNGIAKRDSGLLSLRWRHFLKHNVIPDSELHRELTRCRDERAMNKGNRSAEGCTAVRIGNNDIDLQILMSSHAPTDGNAGPNCKFWIRESRQSPQQKELYGPPHQEYFVFDALTFEGLKQRLRKENKKTIPTLSRPRAPMRT